MIKKDQNSRVPDLSKLCTFWPVYRPALQHDAHEYLLHILDTKLLNCESQIEYNETCTHCSVKKCYQQTSNNIIITPKETHTELLNRYLHSTRACPSCDNQLMTGATFVYAPDVLIVCVLRYTYDRKHKKLVFIKKKSYTLDSTMTVQTASGETVQYTCVAAIQHRGVTPSSGHYHALIKDCGKNWTTYDTKKKVLSNADCRQKMPYILFYRRC